MIRFVLRGPRVRLHTPAGIRTRGYRYATKSWLRTQASTTDPREAQLFNSLYTAATEQARRGLPWQVVGRVKAPSRRVRRFLLVPRKEAAE